MMKDTRENMKDITTKRPGPIWLDSQLAELCTGIAEVMGLNPVQA